MSGVFESLPAVLCLYISRVSCICWRRNISVMAHRVVSSLIFEDHSFALGLAFLFFVSFIFAQVVWLLQRTLVWLLRRTLDTDEDGDDECELRRPPERSQREQMYRAASRPTHDAERSWPDDVPSRTGTRAGAMPRSAGQKAQPQPREVRDRSARSFSQGPPAPEPVVSALTASRGTAHPRHASEPFPELQGAKTRTPRPKSPPDRFIRTPMK